MSRRMNSARHERIRPANRSLADDGRQKARTEAEQRGIRGLDFGLSSKTPPELGDQVAQIPIHWLCQGRCR